MMLWCGQTCHPCPASRTVYDGCHRCTCILCPRGLWLWARQSVGEWRAEGASMMQRPQDALSLSPDEGAALIERLERNALSAEDRCALVQVVRWLFWLYFVVQEAQLSLKRLRTLLFGPGAKTSQARAPEAAAPSSAPG